MVETYDVVKILNKRSVAIVTVNDCMIDILVVKLRKDTKQHKNPIAKTRNVRNFF